MDTDPWAFITITVIMTAKNHFCNLSSGNKASSLVSFITDCYGDTMNIKTEITVRYFKLHWLRKIVTWGLPFDWLPKKQTDMHLQLVELHLLMKSGVPGAFIPDTYKGAHFFFLFAPSRRLWGSLILSSMRPERSGFTYALQGFKIAC